MSKDPVGPVHTGRESPPGPRQAALGCGVLAAGRGPLHLAQWLRAGTAPAAPAAPPPSVRWWVVDVPVQHPQGDGSAVGLAARFPFGC